MLVIDTSHERSIIALVEDSQPLFFDELPFGLRSSQHLLPRLYEGLSSVNRTPKEVESVVVAAGPGSYTGIRVGAAVGKTLSYSLGLPLVGISTLEGLIPEDDGPFAAAIDAKIGGVYLMLGEKKGDTISTEEPFLCPKDEVEAALSSITTIVTPNQKPLLPKIANKTFIERAPDPMEMARIGMRKIAEGLANRNGELDILYLRKTQAEIERQADV